MDIKSLSPLAVSPIRGAAILGVGKSKLYQLIHEKKIAALKIGRRTVVRVSDLEKFLSSLAARGER
jgi:excisionase family DNA binding protein